MSQPYGEIPKAGDSDPMRDMRDTASAAGQRMSDDARAELARLRAQVERLMEERVTPALGSAAETVEDYSRRARERIEDNANALSDTVRERPLIAVAAAAIGGYLIGRMMGGTTYVYTNDRHHR
ncbi:MAG TPA: hypothetical protein VGN83_05430 [Falsiroseomonas sp.]|jgi:ElaB/YqjD/DUF883 family membrane-anchored ribosome-binding protein|nr:hypothetical protein [Falsiroseomonas sp.]